MTRHVPTPFYTLKRRIAAQYGMEPSTLIALKEVDHRICTLNSGETLHRAGDTERRMYCLESGWLIATYHGVDGTRAIVRIFVPGDLVGWEDINWDYATTTVTASVDSVLTAFPKMEVHDIFRLSQQTSWVLHVISSIDYVWATDLNRVIGKLRAKDRLTFFFLQLRSRQAFLEASDFAQCYCPLTQSDIGDALGLTNVSVSRGLSALSKAGLLISDRPNYRLLDVPKLTERADFVDRLNVSTEHVSTGVKRREQKA